MNRLKLLVKGVFALFILFGAVFTTVRLLASEEELADDFGPGVKVLERVYDDGSGPVTITIIIEPSSELPQRRAEAVGVLVGRDGNRFLVGTGAISVEVENISGKETVSANHGGPEIVVVVGPDTIIYQDITQIPVSATEDGERHLQQLINQVEDLDGLPDAAEIEAWGKRDGEFLMADVLVYRQIR